TSRTATTIPATAPEDRPEPGSATTVTSNLFTLLTLRRRRRLLMLLICSLYSPESVFLVFVMVRDPV
ncbi:hypothetical protein PO909_028367, partial [Leuciscus waleckii]